MASKAPRANFRGKNKITSFVLFPRSFVENSSKELVYYPPPPSVRTPSSSVFQSEIERQSFLKKNKSSKDCQRIAEVPV